MPDPAILGTEQTGSTPQSQPPGFFSRLGAGLKAVMPYVTPIANRLAAAAGNYGPLELEHRQRQEDMQQQLQRSQLANQDLQRQLTQKQVENYQTPAQTAQTQVNVKRAETPTTYQTDAGQTGIADTDLQGNTAPRMVTTPNPDYVKTQEAIKQFNPDAPTLYPGGSVAPQTFPKTTQRPATMSQSVGFHIQDPVTGTVYEYGKGGAAMGTQPGPANPNAPLMPGTGKVNALDVGATNQPMPNPRDYAQGTQDPKFRTDYQGWLAAAAAAKQANQLALMKQRGAAFGANKPLPMLTDEGLGAYGTLAGGIATGPNGQPLLTGNQSGPASIAQKRATFAEVDKNLANMRAAIPALDAASMGDRAALVAGLTPSRTKLGQAAEGIGLAHLAPEQRAIVNATRNLRQGVLSLRNVLSSGGAGSDYRVNILESEMPNEQDFAGSSKQLTEKMDAFESIYSDILKSYPQLFTQTPARRSLKPNAAPTAGVGFAAWDKANPSH